MQVSSPRPGVESPRNTPGLTPGPEERGDTRSKLLEYIAAHGPVTVAELVTEFEITAPGIRRHLTELEEAAHIMARTQPLTNAEPTRPRGRPAKVYVVTKAGQSTLNHNYSDLAKDVLNYLAQTGGPDAVAQFAQHRMAALEQALTTEFPADSSIEQRAHILTAQLSELGYAATVRPVPGARAVQICQGHCPVAEVAHEFPELCEAETQVFAKVLGVHVQRLATLPSGGHVCTTNVPLFTAAARTKEEA